MVRVVLKKWSELSSKSGPSCLYKVVRTDLKVAKNGFNFTLNNGLSCLYSGQSWPKKWSDFTLNIGPSCPRKVVLVVLKVVRVVLFPPQTTCICCFRQLALLKSHLACWSRTKRTSSSSHWKLTCFRHSIAEKLMNWR